MSRFKNYLLIANLVVMLFMGGAFVSAQTSTDPLIHGCVKTEDGRLRIIKAGTSCKKNETRLEWNKEGGVALNITPRSVTRDLAPGEESDINANCLAGEKVLGGGFGYPQGARIEIRGMVGSYGYTDADGHLVEGWRTIAKNNGATLAPAVTSRAMCASFAAN
jgi:hypothetical protein